MNRGRKKPIPEDQPAALVLFDYGGRSQWMEPDAALALAKRLRKRGHKCCIVRRKPSPPPKDQGEGT